MRDPIAHRLDNLNTGQVMPPSPETVENPVDGSLPNAPPSCPTGAVQRFAPPRGRSLALSAVRAAPEAVRTVRKRHGRWLVEADVDYSRTRASRRRPPGASPRADARSSLRVAIAIQQPDGQAVATRHAQHAIRADHVASRSRADRSRRYARTRRELDRYRRLGGDDESAADRRCFSLQHPGARPCFQAASPPSSEVQTHFEQAGRAWYAAGW